MKIGNDRILFLQLGFIAVIPLLTLWYFPYQMVLIFYIFQFILSFYLVLVINKKNYSSFSDIRIILKIPHYIDLLILVPSIGLIAITLFNLQIPILSGFLAFLSTTFISGYCVIRILNLDSRLSYLELSILSYLLSYFVTAFTWLIILQFEASIRNLLFFSFQLLLSFITLIFKPLKRVQIKRPRSFSNAIDLFGLIIVCAFALASNYIMYPGFYELLGSDVSRHYAYSIVLGRTPNLYNQYHYLMFHLHESAFLYTSGVSYLISQFFLMALSVFLPVAFYLAAKQHLSHIDNRIPIVATLFWALFTNSYGGLSWIYFAYLKLLNPDSTEIQLLVGTAIKTYNGTIYGILGLWHVPATVSIIILLVLFSLISKKDWILTSHKVIISVLIISMFLTHFPEAAILGIFLAFYGLVVINNQENLDLILQSVIVGLLFVVICYSLLSLVLVRFYMNLSSIISIVLPLLAVTFTIISRRIVSHHMIPNSIMKMLTPLYLRLRSLISNNALSIISLLISTLFVSGFLVWALVVNEFDTLLVNQLGIVPWFIYPLILGINGLLAIMSIQALRDNEKAQRGYLFFLLFLGFTFIMGRMVSIINQLLFRVGYWEKRFVWLLKISIAMLAPLSIVTLTDNINYGKHKRWVKKISTTTLIALIVSFGISTTYLNLDYWIHVTSAPPYSSANPEIEGVNALKGILDQDPYSWAVTVSKTSHLLITTAASPDQLVLKDLLLTARTPDMNFMQLYRHPSYSHPYIYVTQKDFQLLSQQGESIFREHISMLPIVFNNSASAIYNQTKPSFPQIQSKVCLVHPFQDFLTNLEKLAGYYALSGIFADYTKRYDTEHAIFDSEILVLAFDPPNETITSRTFELSDENTQFENYALPEKTLLQMRPQSDYLNYVHQGNSLILLNTNGYHSFGDMMLSISGGLVDSKYISGANFTLDFPNYIQIDQIQPKSSTAEIIARYVSNSGIQIPYIIREDYGLGTITYVNVYPILRAIHEGFMLQPVSNVLNDLLSFIDFPSMDDIVIEADGYCDEVEGKNVTIESDTILFTTDSAFENISLKTPDGISNFTNISNIVLHGPFMLHLKDVVFHNGMGLYSCSQIESVFSLSTLSNSSIIEFQTENGIEYSFQDCEEIFVVPRENCTVLTRTPTIKLDYCVFRSLYSYRDLEWVTGANGENLIVNGTTTFTIGISDGYMQIHDVSISGKWELDPPPSEYDSFSLGPVYILSFVIVFPAIPVIWMVLKSVAYKKVDAD